ncbi:MAG: winged helix DNA-binding domain-containing protein [Verrucomicrobiales bacterium]|nr:winged helix DNA-binding domain-containing protein [Verrucomicrobiales bacterium]
MNDIAQQRLVNQHIASGVFAKPEDEVKWLAAVQAQDYLGAKWSLGLRLRGMADSDIERAFNDGAILRTHLLRPTWHFVAPEDIRWLLALTAPRVHVANAYMYRKLELDRAVLKRSEAVLTKALQGGKHLTREELRDALRRAGIASDSGQRMGYLLMCAELDGIVCSGPRIGKSFTYALLEERVPPARTFTRSEALAELSRRYFNSRGPATVEDFAKWSGLTMTDARNGLNAGKGLIQSDVLETQTYWFSASSRCAKVKSPTAFLLSIYDEYISGYKDRSAIVDEKDAERLIAMGNALTHVTVVRGRIVGTWKRTFAKNTVAIEATHLRTLSRAEHRAFASAAERYGKFFQTRAIW